MSITFYNELTGQRKEKKFYEMVEVRIPICMTPRSLKTTEFTETSEIKEDSFQLIGCLLEFS